MMATLLAQRLLLASIETTVATLVVLGVSAFALRRAPRAVALLWLVVLAKPLLTLAGGSLVHVRVPRELHAPLAPRAEATKVITRRGAVAREQTETRSWNPAYTLAGVWLAGALLLLGRSLYHRQRLRALVKRSRAASPRIVDACARLGETDVEIRISDALDGPAIGGAFRPVILIPAWMDARADDAQLAWTLRHELRHAGARDTLALSLRELALIAMWFHPLVWLAAAKWEVATERACDRDVVSSDADAVDYADALYRTLLNVRQQRRLQLAAGLFATRSKIGTRIAALVERPLAPRLGRAGAAAAFAIGLGLVIVGCGLAAPARAHHRGNVEEVFDGRSFAMRYDAVIGFDGDRIDSLSSGGFIEMRETRDGTTRVLRLDGTTRGIVRNYEINGRTAPPDDSFERSMTAQLRKSMNR
jgi:beta-lactamase regulating signal transducer with metallopeptidase domain